MTDIGLCFHLSWAYLQHLWEAAPLDKLFFNTDWWLKKKIKPQEVQDRDILSLILTMLLSSDSTIFEFILLGLLNVKHFNDNSGFYQWTKQL